MLTGLCFGAALGLAATAWFYEAELDRVGREQEREQA